MKIQEIIKTIFYIILGTLVLIFNNHVMPYVNYLVGFVMIIYGLEELIIVFIKKELKTEKNTLFDGIILLLLAALIMIVGKDDIVKICVIWGIWSILREAKEMAKDFHNIVNKRLGYLSILESIIIITLSFMMVINPSEHHAHTHVILLGIELILEVGFPIAYAYLLKLFNKDKEIENEKEAE